MTSPHASRPAVDEIPGPHVPYVDLVPDGDVVAHLEDGMARTRALLGTLPEARGGYRYAEGKWSIKEVLNHLVDAERVFSFRLLTFARGDAGPLPGFDEETYAPAAEADRRSLAAILEEFTAVRAATLTLLRGLPDAAWGRRGTANGRVASVRALAWVIAGHEIHHRGVLAERYLRA